jgi:hypothetical protein
MNTTTARNGGWIRLAAVWLILVAALISPATVAHADDTIGIAIAPAKGDAPDGRTRFNYHTDPGTAVSDSVIVTNAGTKSLKITLLATDAFNTEDGSYALLESDKEPTGAGSWVRFENDNKKLTFTLAPQKSKVVPLRVTVPTTAAPGDHAAGIIASATFGEGQLAVERRIASRLYVRVSGALQPMLTAASFAGDYHTSINPMDGSATVTAVISNTGNVALSGTIDLEARTWFGTVVGKSTSTQLSEILPGNTRTVAFEISGVPQVGYVVPHLLLRSAVTADAPNPGPLPVVQRDTFLLAIPWSLLVLIIAGVAAWFFLRLRRGREDQQAREWAEHTEAEALRRAQEQLEASPFATTKKPTDSSGSTPGEDGQ